MHQRIVYDKKSFLLNLFSAPCTIGGEVWRRYRLSLREIEQKEECIEEDEQSNPIDDASASQDFDNSPTALVSFPLSAHLATSSYDPNHQFHDVQAAREKKGKDVMTD